MPGKVIQTHRIKIYRPENNLYKLTKQRLLHFQ